MALHPAFPTSPYAPLIPEQRWFPADETLRDTAYEKLLPPLVSKIRDEVHAWRNTGYLGASQTSVALLHWWFETDHLLETANGTLAPFQYYYAQREAVETVIWLHDVRKARDKFDLLRFDASGSVSHGMFPEDWPRYVLKMATGAGKTKVISLLIVWSFFHKLYELDSTLSRNFLVIAPNIIVLDRLRADFDGLQIFFTDPILPDNGHHGQNWRDDFQLTLHIQDDVRVLRETGNIFLTNIHRVFLGDVPEPSLEDDDLRDYFLSDAFGAKPSGKTADSKTDLGEIVREIEEIAVFNDEAHHTVHLVGGYDVLYPKVRDFMKFHLLEPPMDTDKNGLETDGESTSSESIRVHPRSSVVPLDGVDLEDPVIIENNSQTNAGKILYDSFKAAMNALTIADTDTTRIEDYIRLQHTRPFRTDHRPFLAAQKSIFTKIVGEVNAGGFELAFAAFLEAAPDVKAFTKNYLAIGFKFDYVKANGDLSNYVPDFIARDTEGTVWIIETKGREELDLPQKMARLSQWCADATAAEENGIRYDFVYVDQGGFEKHKPATLADLATSFTE